MHELKQDPFYELIGQEYDRCVVDYCLITPDAPYRGIRSHREAVLFAPKVVRKIKGGATIYDRKHPMKARPT